MNAEFKKFVEGVDYEFIFPEGGEKDEARIKLLAGNYKDTVYWYGRVSIEEDKKSEQAILSFNYEVLQNTDGSTKNLEKNEDFKSHIGNILLGMIMERFSEDNLEKIEVSENTDDSLSE